MEDPSQRPLLFLSQSSAPRPRLGAGVLVPSALQREGSAALRDLIVYSPGTGGDTEEALDG